eukprot:4598794-Amphidinium_carterae.1
MKLLSSGWVVLLTGVAGADAATRRGGLSTSLKIARLVGTISGGVGAAAITKADKPSASLTST